MHFLLKIISILLAANIFLPISTTFCPLSNYVKHYDAINPTTTLKTTSDIEYITISFQAFNTKFQLLLQPQFTLLENSITIKITNPYHSHTFPSQNLKRSLLIGRVINVANSSVIGTRIETFQGVIETQTETYHIEDSDRYFPRPVPFLSIIFKQSDISFKEINKKSLICNQTSKNEVKIGAQAQKKPKYLNLKRKTICTVKLFADHTFFNHQTDHEIVRVILEMILLLQQAQNIFSTTDFDDDGIPEKLGFQVNAIHIVLNRHTPNYRLFEDDIDVEDYLDLFADYDFDKYCLGIAITHRRFKSGVLGVTYTASPNPKKSGGICQRRVKAKGQKKPKSYNTVVVTVVGYDGRRMPRFLSGLTVAHELGHAFGSDHDPPGDYECCPHKLGNYLMSAYTLRGRHLHNYQFSACSRRQITEVLRYKGVCFVESKPVCGNAIVEEGEECDCGTEDQCDMIDPCCTPKGGLGSDDECTVRVSQGLHCSPVGKPCCSTRCQFVPAHEIKDCTGGNDCYFASSCNGLSADCPQLTVKSNGESCRDGLGSCLDSVCIDVVCTLRRLFQCICTDLVNQCHLCCKAKMGTCKPATKFGIWKKQNVPYYRPAGEECDDDRGFCNFAGECTTSSHTHAREVSGQSYTDKKVLDIVTILVICILVVAILSLVVVILYVFTPVGTMIQNFLNK